MPDAPDNSLPSSPFALPAASGAPPVVPESPVAPQPPPPQLPAPWTAMQAMPQYQKLTPDGRRTAFQKWSNMALAATGPDSGFPPEQRQQLIGKIQGQYQQFDDAAKPGLLSKLGSGAVGLAEGTAGIAGSPFAVASDLAFGAAGAPDDLSTFYTNQLGRGVTEMSQQVEHAIPPDVRTLSALGSPGTSFAERRGAPAPNQGPTPDEQKDAIFDTLKSHVANGTPIDADFLKNWGNAVTRSAAAANGEDSAKYTGSDRDPNSPENASLIQAFQKTMDPVYANALKERMTTSNAIKQVSTEQGQALGSLPPWAQTVVQQIASPQNLATAALMAIPGAGEAALGETALGGAAKGAAVLGGLGAAQAHLENPQASGKELLESAVPQAIIGGLLGLGGAKLTQHFDALTQAQKFQILAHVNLTPEDYAKMTDANQKEATVTTAVQAAAKAADEQVAKVEARANQGSVLQGGQVPTLEGPETQPLPPGVIDTTPSKFGLPTVPLRMQAGNETGPQLFDARGNPVGARTPLATATLDTGESSGPLANVAPINPRDPSSNLQAAPTPAPNKDLAAKEGSGQAMKDYKATQPQVTPKATQEAQQSTAQGEQAGQPAPVVPASQSEPVNAPEKSGTLANASLRRVVPGSAPLASKTLALGPAQDIGAGMTNEKPLELMTPEEAQANSKQKAIDAFKEAQANPMGGMAQRRALGEIRNADDTQFYHDRIIKLSLAAKEPVSAIAADAYGIKPPEGYQRVGDQYVYQPKGAEAPADRYTPYKIRDRYGVSVPVRQREAPQGFGDTLHNTLEEAQAQGEFNRKVDIQDAARAEAGRVQGIADAAKEKERQDLNGFDEGMTPMQKGRAVQQLSDKEIFRPTKGVMSVKNYIRGLVAEGRTIIPGEKPIGRRLQTPDGLFLGEDKIGKTAMDYAAHLIDQRDEAKLPQPKPEEAQNVSVGGGQAKPLELKTPEEADIPPYEKSLPSVSSAEKRFGPKGLDSPYATPEAVARWKAEKKAYTQQHQRAVQRTENSNTYWHAINDAIEAERPVGAAAMEYRFRGDIPKGYVLQGDRYVFQSPNEDAGFGIKPGTSPLLKNYLELKKSAPNAIVLMRLGDFYEVFGDDAKKVSDVAKIPLTKRGENAMAGVPYHRSTDLIKQLRDAGYSVAIAEKPPTGEPPNAPPQLIQSQSPSSQLSRVSTRENVRPDSSQGGEGSRSQANGGGSPPAGVEAPPVQQGAGGKSDAGVRPPAPPAPDALTAIKRGPSRVVVPADASHVEVTYKTGLQKYIPKDTFAKQVSDGIYKGPDVASIRAVAKDAKGKWQTEGDITTKPGAGAFVLNPKDAAAAVYKYVKDKVAWAAELAKRGVDLSKGALESLWSYVKGLSPRQLDIHEAQHFQDTAEGKAKEYFTDSDARLRALVNAKGVDLPPAFNPADARENLPGQRRYGTEYFKARTDQVLKSIIQNSKDAQIPVAQYAKELNQELVATHAPERNAVHGEGAAGMTDAQAAQIKSDLKSRPYYDKLKADADSVRAVNQEALQRRLDTQLITQKTFDKLNELYPNHVPLNRILPEDAMKDVDSKLGGGPGMNVMSSGMRGAKGSDLPVQDVLGNVQANAIDAATRGAKNMADLQSVDFFRNNADKLNADGPAVKVITPKIVDKTKSGALVYADPEHPDRTLISRENGKPVYIEFHDKGLGQVMQGLNVAAPNGVLVRALGRMVNLMGQMQTTFSLGFKPNHFIRSAENLFFNISNETGQGTTAQNIKRMIPYQAQSLKAVADWMRGVDTPLARQYDAYRKGGGIMGGFDSMSREEQVNSIQKRLADLQRSKLDPRTYPATAVKAFHALDQFSDATSRFTAYRLALDAGKSTQEANAIARRVALDFDKNGTATKELNAIFKYSKVGLQSTGQLAKVLANPKSAALAAGTIGLVVTAQNNWNDAMDPNWRKDIPQGVQDSLLPIISKPRAAGSSESPQYIPMPFAYAYTPIKVAMQEAYNMATGRQSDPAAAAKHVAGSAFLKVLNPFGGTFDSQHPAESVAQTLTPTALRPLVEAGLNRAWTGKSIHPDYNGAAPSQVYFPGTKNTLGGRASIGTSGVLAKAGLQVSPNTLGYVAGQYGAGPLAAARSLTDVGAKIARGEPLTGQDIPGSHFLASTNPNFQRTRENLAPEQAALEADKTQQAVRTRQAEELYDKLKAAPDQKASILQQAWKNGDVPKDPNGQPDPLFLREVNRLAANDHLDAQARVLKGMDTEGRAQWLVQQLHAMQGDPAQWNAFVQRNRDDKVMTPAVTKRMNELLAQTTALASK